MNKKTKLLSLITGTSAVFCLVVTAVVAQTRLTNQSKVFINGIGPVRVGMNVSQASQAAGVRLVSIRPNQDRSCFYVKPENEPKNLGFMVTNDSISRVDVWANSKITTLGGAKIGDTETQIKSLYPGQIKVTPHKYVSNGHYLTFIPKDPALNNYRIIFETNGKNVTAFRAGKLPEVEYVEGCS